MDLRPEYENGNLQRAVPGQEPGAGCRRVKIATMPLQPARLEFTPEGITRLAQIAFDVNERTENIGARRLSTVMEHLLDEVSFDATKLQGQTVSVDAAYVDARLGALSRNEDLSRYIL